MSSKARPGSARCFCLSRGRPVSGGVDELAGLSMLKASELRRRAEDAGASNEALDEALDADQPTTALASLVLDLEGGSRAREEERIRRELEGLRPSQLRRKALEVGLPEEQIDDAQDSDNPTAVLVTLILAATLHDAEARTPSPLTEPRHDLTGLEGSQLATEFEALQLRELRQRAKAQGMSRDQLDGFMDTDEPQEALIAWLIEAQTAEARDRAVLMSELQGLRLKDLRKRANDAGIEAADLDAAMDADDPSKAVISVIVGNARSKVETAVDVGESEATVINKMPSQDKQSLEQELHGLPLKDLRQRARDMGVSSMSLENAMDAGDPAADVIRLVVNASTRSSGDKPHSRALKQQPSRHQAKTRKALFAQKKHTMLSYQWDDQDRVVATRRRLNKLGWPTWMDIDGGTPFAESFLQHLHSSPHRLRSEHLKTPQLGCMQVACSKISTKPWLQVSHATRAPPRLPVCTHRRADPWHALDHCRCRECCVCGVLPVSEISG